MLRCEHGIGCTDRCVDVWGGCVCYLVWCVHTRNHELQFHNNNFQLYILPCTHNTIIKYPAAKKKLFFRSRLTFVIVAIRRRVRFRRRKAGSFRASRAFPSGARVHTIYSAVLRLHVLDLLNVLESVNGASEVYLPDCGIRFIPVFPRVHGPRPEKRSVSLSVVSSLLSMDPRDFKDVLLLIQPLEAGELSGVDLANEPIPHTLRTSVRFCVRGTSHTIDCTRHGCRRQEKNLLCSA